MPYDLAAIKRFGNVKMGPLPRKAWIGIGAVGLGGVWYYRRQKALADTAGPTDPTVAGAAQDAQGNQAMQSSAMTSMYDPYTSGYNGQGYDLLLGAGGVVRSTGAGSAPAVMTPAAAPIAAVQANPALPGSTAPTVNVTYGGPTYNSSTTMVEPTPSAQRATHVTEVKRAMHNVKNGRHPTHKTKPPVRHHKPKAHHGRAK